MRPQPATITFASLIATIFFGMASADGAPAAQATQHPVNQSGVKGRIDFTNVTGGILVTGTATGLETSVGRYVSLVYDLGSVPGGPTVCEPTEEMPGMFVGIWAVDALGNGSLIQLVPAEAVAPLEAIDSISIRDSTINGGFGIEAVVACGQIAVHAGR